MKLLIALALSLQPVPPSPSPVVLPSLLSAEYGELIDVEAKVTGDAKAVKWRVIPGDAQIRWYPDKRVCVFVARPKADTVYTLVASTAINGEPFDAISEIMVSGLQVGPAPPPGPPTPVVPVEDPITRKLRAAFLVDKKVDNRADANLKAFAVVYQAASEQRWQSAALMLSYLQGRYDGLGKDAAQPVLPTVKAAINELLTPYTTASWDAAKTSDLLGKIAAALKRISGPAPPTPVDPVVPVVPDSSVKPLSEQGLRVFMVYESGEIYPAAQWMIFTSVDVRQAIRAKGGKLRLYDQQNKSDRDEPWVQEAHGKWKNEKLPWLYVSDGKQAWAGPLPATIQDMLELLKRFN